MERIPLALLLREDRRRPDDVARAVDAAARLGLDITGQGRASITARASPEIFARLFGSPVTKLPAEAPGVRDAGQPAGYAAAGSLPVPATLEQYGKFNPGYITYCSPSPACCARGRAPLLPSGP